MRGEEYEGYGPVDLEWPFSPFIWLRGRGRDARSVETGIFYGGLGVEGYQEVRGKWGYRLKGIAGSVSDCRL